jgi:hypothetical protein
VRRAALLQVATLRHAALFDLPLCGELPGFDALVSSLFGSGRQLLLGVGLANDFQVLRKSCPNVEGFKRVPPAVLEVGDALRQLQQRLDQEIQQQAQQQGQSLEQAATCRCSASGPESNSAPSHQRQPPPHTLPRPQHPHSPQPQSLSATCRRWLGEPLDKAEQCSDWRARPLSAEQVAYAANDAHCLVRLFAVLQAHAAARASNGGGGGSSAVAAAVTAVTAAKVSHSGIRGIS